MAFNIELKGLKALSETEFLGLHKLLPLFKVREKAGKAFLQRILLRVETVNFDPDIEKKLFNVFI